MNDTIKLVLQLLIPGLCLGCVYGLNGIGAALLYKGSHTINNAQGAVVGFGALLGYTFQRVLGWGLLPATLAATIIVFLFGMFLQVGVISQVEKRAPIYVVIATLALNIVITNANYLIFGSYVYESATITINGSKYLHIAFADLNILWSNIVAIGVSLVAMLAVHFFLNKTKFGAAMRAAAMDPFAAGKSTMFMSMMMLGGFGTLLGPALGAVLITVIMEFLRGIPGVGTYMQLAYGLILLAVMMFLPQGLSGLIADIRLKQLKKKVAEKEGTAC